MTWEELRQRVAAMGATGLQGAIADTARDARIDMEAYGKDHVLARFRQRNGHLRGSVVASSVHDGTSATITVRAGGTQAGSAPLAYARAQEDGATIRPVNGRYLRIPLRAAQTAAGVDRRATPLRLTAPDEFFAWKSPRTGKLFLRRREDGAFWYLLTEGPVTIQGRHYLRDARDRVQAEAPALFAQHIRARAGL